MLPFALLINIIFSCSSTSVDTSSQTTLNITSTSISSTECGIEEILEDILTVNVEDGVVQVVHENYEESSCLSFGIDGVLEGSNINVEYSKNGEECDCIDLYRLEYSIEDLESGTYTLNSPGGDSTSLVIE